MLGLQQLSPVLLHLNSRFLATLQLKGSRLVPVPIQLHCETIELPEENSGTAIKESWPCCSQCVFTACLEAWLACSALLCCHTEREAIFIPR